MNSLPGLLSALTDHLWQSTLFAAAIAALTLLFRRNSASTRYWLWLAASIKFLVPFSLLSALGARLYEMLRADSGHTMQVSRRHPQTACTS